MSGVEPLELRCGLASPLYGKAWAADVVRLAALSSTIDLAVMEPHTYRSTPNSTARSATLLVGVAAGRLCGSAAGRPFEVLPGQALFVDARQWIQSQVDEQVQLVRVLTETASGPHVDDGLGLDPWAAPVLLDTPVLRSCLTAANSLVRHTHSAEHEPDDVAVASLMSGIHHALLIESSRQRGDEREPSTRALWRAQIEIFIEAHFREQSLTPATIAAALGVSLRTVHNAFAETATTVGAFIRSRRVEEVGRTALSVGARPAEIAAACGFRSPAHMARAFRAVTGQTLGGARRDDAPTRATEW